LRKKIEKEWYTCDRCGMQIEYPVRKLSLLPPIRKTMSVTVEACCLKQYLGKVEEMTVDGETVNIHGLFVKYYDSDVRDIDLCPKCARAFNRFLKGKHVGGIYEES